MKGLILAAGRGSRMPSLTFDRPKCLVEVESRTLLDRQISALTRAGITELAIVGGWQIDSLRSSGLPVHANADWETTTMVNSLLVADPWIGEESVLVSYGDIVFGSEIIQRMMACDDELVIAYDRQWLAKWSLRFADPLTDAETFQLFPGEYLKDIGQRASDLVDIEGQYMGLLLIRPTAREKIRWVVESTEILSMTHLLELLVKSEICPVKCVATYEPWFEFDSVEDIESGARYVSQLDELERRGDHLMAPIAEISIETSFEPT
jgi:choline kinase